MVGYYSFVIPKNSDAILYGEIFINWIDSIISDSFVENKAIIDTRPSWAYAGDDDLEDVFIKGITFKYKNTEFVISTSSKSSSSSKVFFYIYARNNRISLAFDRTNDIINNYSSVQTVRYLIGQNNEYFIISGGASNQFAVIKIDSPVNPVDTDVYVSILNSSRGTYNKSFNTENVNNIPVSFALGTQINYPQTFLVNYYNNKTELNYVYAYTQEYGIRGRISNLVSLTSYRSTSLGTFYMVNGVEYVGLYNFNNIISSEHRGILLKSY